MDSKKNKGKNNGNNFNGLRHQGTKISKFSNPEFKKIYNR